MQGAALGCPQGAGHGKASHLHDQFRQCLCALREQAQRKGRTTDELHQIITWLTGYDDAGLQRVINDGTDFEKFFDQAPAMNPARSQIKGVVCGVHAEEIAEPVMREIRYLDKLVDELARGKKMEKILR